MDWQLVVGLVCVAVSGGLLWYCLGRGRIRAGLARRGVPARGVGVEELSDAQVSAFLDYLAVQRVVAAGAVVVGFVGVLLIATAGYSWAVLAGAGLLCGGVLFASSRRLLRP